MSLDICSDCNLSICDSDGSCGCRTGKYRVTYEFRSGKLRREYFQRQIDAENACDKFESSTDPRRSGCEIEVQCPDGTWCPFDGDIPYP